MNKGRKISTIRGEKDLQPSCFRSENFQITQISQETEKKETIYQLCPGSSFSLDLLYFDIPFQLVKRSSDGRYSFTSMSDQFDFPFALIYDIEGEGIKKVVNEGVSKMRKKITTRIQSHLREEMRKVFDDSRGWDLKIVVGEDNHANVESNSIYLPLVFESIMTKHKILAGYKMKEGEFIYRLQKQDSKEIEKYDSSGQSEGAIDLIYSLKSYFRDATNGSTGRYSKS